MATTYVPFTLTKHLLVRMDPSLESISHISSHLLVHLRNATTPSPQLTPHMRRLLGLYHFPLARVFWSRSLRFKTKASPWPLEWITWEETKKENKKSLKVDAWYAESRLKNGIHYTYFMAPRLIISLMKFSLQLQCIESLKRSRDLCITH